MADVRLAIRSLLKNPGFTAVVVLTYGRLLTPSEMAFFSAAAARAETTVSLRAAAGLAIVDASGFNLATGGRATMRTRLP